MLHDDVFKRFKKYFPKEYEETSRWFPNGKNSIRVRMVSKMDDFIFTYNGKNDWKFESVDLFIKRLMKGGDTMNVGLYDDKREK